MWSAKMKRWSFKSTYQRQAWAQQNILNRSIFLLLALFGKLREGETISLVVSPCLICLSERQPGMALCAVSYPSGVCPDMDLNIRIWTKSCCFHGKQMIKHWIWVLFSDYGCCYSYILNSISSHPLPVGVFKYAFDKSLPYTPKMLHGAGIYMTHM